MGDVGQAEVPPQVAATTTEGAPSPATKTTAKGPKRRRVERRKSLPCPLAIAQALAAEAPSPPAQTPAAIREYYDGNRKRERRKTLATIDEEKPTADRTDMVGSRSGSYDSARDRRRMAMALATNTSSQPLTPRGSVVVELRRTNGAHLGLGIAGGVDRHRAPMVTHLAPGSIAHRCDQLQVGDLLTAVNGIRVGSLTHEEILTVLRNAGDHIRLAVEYDLNDACFQRPINTMNKCTDITLEKEGGSFGFTLRGGAFGPDLAKSRPLTITSIRPGGPADREGRLRVGDRILGINGIDFYSATLSTALKMLTDSVDAVCLTVEYDVSVLETVRRAQGPLLLEIDKVPGVDLGIDVNISEYRVPGKRQCVYITSVIAASIADRCGAVHIGDELLAIDRVSLEYTTLAEVKQLLRGCSAQAPVVRLEIVPHSQMSREPSREPGQRRVSSFRKKTPQPVAAKDDPKGCRRRTSGRAKSHDRSVITNGHAPRARNDYSYSPHRPPPSVMTGSVPNVFYRPSAVLTDAQSVLSRSYMQQSMRANGHTNWNRRPSYGSLSASISGVPCGQVCHSEVMEVVLNSYAKGGFGLILHRQHGFTEASRSPLFISYIERGSPSEKSGVLQVGDRVLAINDYCTANGTAEEANYILRKATSPLTLTVEFDVIETVLPTSGVFTVKLAKRGNNLGIVARSETDGQKGEPVVISDIRTGSVAHRCGSIQPGDRLIAIDNIPLDTCTVEESMRLLQRSSDIVKLRVKKGPAFGGEEVDSAPQTVIYSVELSRRRQPLGITIASTGERGDPVYISQLAPGGLADRTGALHVNDQILAINGESLAGKKVAEAMQMLQNTTDTVTLKMARLIDPPFISSFPPPPHHNNPSLLRGSSVHNHPSMTMILPSSVDQLSDRDTSDKLGTPVQSIDSAVESLDDSPDSHNRHSSARHSGEQLASSSNGKYAEELSVQLNRSLAAWKMGSETGGVGSSHALPPTSTSTQTVGGVGIAPGHRPPAEAVSTTSSGPEPGWDSGLSSTDTAGGGDFCGCSCQDPRASNNNNNTEDWVRILEALETVGEAEMLRKLEESIMGGTVPQCDHGGSTSCRPAGSTFALNNALTSRAHFPGTPTFTNTILRHPPLASSSTAQLTSSHRNEADSLSLNSSVSGASMSDVPPPMPPPKPPRPMSTSMADSRLEAILKGLESIPFMTSPLPTMSTSMTSALQRGSNSATPAPELCPPSTSGGNNAPQQPLEIHRVTLHKDPAYNDFGFSVSDGDNDSGVYINKIRPGGPAYSSGNVRPFDRILQVNDTSLQFLDCILTVPLLLSATDKIDLLLCRDPMGAVNRHAPIAEEDEVSVVSTKDSAV